MTSLKRLALAAGAGEPDPVLALRIDVVAAAVKLLAAQERVDQEFLSGRSRPPREQLKATAIANVAWELAMEELLIRTEKYRVALRRRNEG